jgi:mRNA-degrading endonuclease toxin of MazEF toxin-antitoxin module
MATIFSDIKKDYKEWHSIKSNIQNTKKRPRFINEREIWYCGFGDNIGVEINGKGSLNAKSENLFLRPVLILKITGAYTFIGIPLTTKIDKIKDKNSNYLINHESVISALLFNQIKTFDSKRLYYKKYQINNKRFSEIKKQLFQYLE